ncbi:proton channel OTOP3-like [Gastrophryne carolinensis]
MLELQNALASTATGKTQGPNGLHLQYYKKLFPQLAPKLLLMMNSIIEGSTPPADTLRAHIVVIPKEGKDPNLCASYRPISLLNADIKLFAKILASRTLHSVIGTDQVGFMPLREARDNTTKVLNLIHLAQRQNVPALLLFTDAEKAFDRVNWQFMRSVLSHVGLGPNMLSWIESLYSFPSASVRVNGCLSRPFEISNGTRQGCPLTPLIFFLTFEPFLCRVRVNPDVKGVANASGHYKVAAYADNLIFCLSYPEVTLPNLMKELREYGSLSGYKINFQKSEALNINISPHRFEKIKNTFPFRWAGVSVKYLGTSISSDLQKTYALNFPPLLKKFEMETASKGRLSWFGRCNAVKMTLLPCLLYLLQALLVFIPPMVTTDSNQSVGHNDTNIRYEHSWLHRYCASTLTQHQRARGSGRLLSGLMAMNVIFLGAALLSSVVLSSLPNQSSNIYLSILMLCSSIWILFYLLNTRRKPVALALNDHHAGALWLRASLAVFGICSLLLSIFKIGYDVTQVQCKLPVEILFSVMEIIFISTQTCLLWIACKDCVQLQHNLTRFGIMLTLATNLLLWLMAVINDSVHREIEESQSKNISDNSSGCLCPKYSTCWTFQRGYVTLYPFNLEYSLVCASMLFIMWRNVGRKEALSHDISHPKFCLRGVLYGPIIGVTALIVGIGIFIQYQIQATAGAVISTSLTLYYVYSIILLPLMVITCIIGIIAQTFKEKNSMEHLDQKSDNGEDKKKTERVTKHENYKWCRHRRVEKSKVSDHSEVDKGELKEEKGDNGKDLTDHQTFEECIEDTKENNETFEGQIETGHFSENVPGEEAVKELSVEHMDTGHHHCTRQRKFSVDQKCSASELFVHQTPKNYTRSLEIILLLVAALGQFSIAYYSIVAIVATSEWSQINILNLSYAVLMILQHMFQNIFIIEGMKKEQQIHTKERISKESKEEESRRMSLVEIRRASLAYLQSVGRLSISRRLVKEIALFLVLCNIMFWAMSAFGEHPLYTNGLEREFYGSSTWFSILNFGLPLSVFYRMHSVGGLLEVYLTA